MITGGNKIPGRRDKTSKTVNKSNHGSLSNFLNAQFGSKHFTVGNAFPNTREKVDVIPLYLRPRNLRHEVGGSLCNCADRLQSPGPQPPCLTHSGTGGGGRGRGEVGERGGGGEEASTGLYPGPLASTGELEDETKNRNWTTNGRILKCHVRSLDFIL